MFWNFDKNTTLKYGFNFSTSEKYKYVDILFPIFILPYSRFREKFKKCYYKRRNDRIQAMDGYIAPYGETYGQRAVNVVVTLKFKIGSFMVKPSVGIFLSLFGREKREMALWTERYYGHSH